MNLAGVSLFGDDARAPLVDIAIDNGLIAAIEPAAVAPSPPPASPCPRSPMRMTMRGRCRRPRSAAPASRWRAGCCGLARCRRSIPISARSPLSGARRAAARLRSWPITRALHGPMSPLDEAREVARAASRRRRPRHASRCSCATAIRWSMDRPSRAGGNAASRRARIVEAQFLEPMPGVAEQVARVEAIAAAVESPTFTVQFGPSGPQWCSDALLGAIARSLGADRPARPHASPGDDLSARLRRPRLSARHRDAFARYRPAVANA